MENVKELASVMIIYYQFATLAPVVDLSSTRRYSEEALPKLKWSVFIPDTVCYRDDSITLFVIGFEVFIIESIKNTSIENDSKTYIIAYVKIKKMKIYYPLCQTYSPTVV